MSHTNPDGDGSSGKECGASTGYREPRPSPVPASPVTISSATTDATSPSTGLTKMRSLSPIGNTYENGEVKLTSNDIEGQASRPSLAQRSPSRSQTGPTSGSTHDAASTPKKTCYYRTQPCKFWDQMGRCKKANRCNFKHDMSMRRDRRATEPPHHPQQVPSPPFHTPYPFFVHQFSRPYPAGYYFTLTGAPGLMETMSPQSCPSPIPSDAQSGDDDIEIILDSTCNSLPGSSFFPTSPPGSANTSVDEDGWYYTPDAGHTVSPCGSHSFSDSVVDGVVNDENGRGVHHDAQFPPPPSPYDLDNLRAPFPSIAADAAAFLPTALVMTEEPETDSQFLTAGPTSVPPRSRSAPPC